MKTLYSDPPRNCRRCPRLVEYRQASQEKFPDKFNAPVPSFGPTDAEFLIVGLAPGLKGANFTGRPFTGDYAGDLLYQTLDKFGYTTGEYKAHANDGVKMVNCRITNAVRCVPPQNKPTGTEVKKCHMYFDRTIKEMPNLKIMLALGKIAHDTVVRSYGMKLSANPFGHRHTHELPDGLKLIDSYHCSRYNTQTKRLTTEMFEDVFRDIQNFL